ncbi:hypothetical protein ABK040_002155 [Willaertia magna]
MSTGRAILLESMKKLYTVYEETGGKELQIKDQLVEEGSKNAFEANKILLVKKLDLTREKINERDELAKKNKKSNQRVIRLNQNIKKMIRYLKKDYSHLEDIHRRSAKKKLFGKQTDPRELAQQAEDLKLIKAHVDQVEKLDKRRFEEGYTGDEKGDSARKQLLSINDEEENSSEQKKPLMSEHLINEEDLPKDARDYGNLPRINIEASLSQVHLYKKQMDEGLDLFSKKIDQLKIMSEDIGTELDEQNQLLDNMNDKAENEIDRLKKLNEKTEQAQKLANDSLRICCIVLGLSIVAIVIAGVAIYLVQFFKG